ncbi:MAG: hypothetical protein M3Y21_00300 [Candidatus Eremiobacteraeota bacterium]|nr:hypothetical protein [Candidatus Eremiobacteraeota bacterium]
MQVLPQERPLDLITGTPLVGNTLNNPTQLLSGMLGGGISQMLGGVGNDSIARLAPPSMGILSGNNQSTAGGFNPLGFMGMGAIQSAIQSIMGMLQQLMQLLGGSTGAAPGPIQNGGEQYYQNATGSSTGDPHLAFNGTTSSGQTDNGRFDNMNGQNDLLDSDSFDGGFQISTQTTAPNANGVTNNSSATVSTQNGAFAVSLDRDGDASILENGTSMSLQNGQTVDFGNGETVSRGQDGSLTVTDNNSNGGQITTTLQSNGTGVNVNATALNVDLGGDLYNQTIAQEQQPQPPGPISGPIPGPIPGPVPSPIPGPISGPIETPWRRIM